MGTLSCNGDKTDETSDDVSRQPQWLGVCWVKPLGGGGEGWGRGGVCACVLAQQVHG